MGFTGWVRSAYPTRMVDVIRQFPQKRMGSGGARGQVRSVDPG